MGQLTQAQKYPMEAKFVKTPKIYLLKECRSYFKTFEFNIAMLRTTVMKG